MSTSSALTTIEPIHASAATQWPRQSSGYYVMLRLLPHLLTLLRLFAAPVVVWLLVQARYREALALVLLAGLTDWFDGYTARLLGVSGRLGVILDPLADKVLLVVLFLALGYVAKLPLWLVALVIGRDLVIVIGALLLRLFRNIYEFLPTIWGKVSTFFQIVLVLLVLIHSAFPYQFFWWLRNIALALCAFFTAFSGLGYVRIGIRLARQPARPPRPA